jgi:hypothetical protein
MPARYIQLGDIGLLFAMLLWLIVMVTALLKIVKKKPH